MATSEERMKILKMVQERKITAEEGAKLLGALGKAGERQATPSEGESRWLRVRITDLNSGKASVNVNLPLGLVNVGLKMGARFIPNMEGIQVEELAEALRQGLTGKIIDVVDEEEGQRVEVYVE
ncbi:MAG TPA: hypothetical protein VJJ46_03460 [Anaerolineales bacterium]|nr:hypothetical protein [Anaerolineales bacterium]